MIRAVLKFAGVFAIIMTHLVHHSLVNLIIRDEQKRLRYFLRSIARTAGWALKILNVKVEFPNGKTDLSKSFIVCNHVSYLDALVLFRHYPSLFITSVEIRETFLLGKLCDLAGCFFVERRPRKRDPQTINREMGSMKQRLTEGFSILLFPEGTSSNGSSVLPFKTPFFQTVIDCQVPLYPLCLKYVSINDEKFSPANADLVCWYGDMTFPDHLFTLCRQKNVVAHVTEIPAIYPAPEHDRVGLARLSHDLISGAYAKS